MFGDRSLARLHDSEAIFSSTLRNRVTADPSLDVADFGLIEHLLLALTQEQYLIEQAGGQSRPIVDALAKHMPVHLYSTK